MFRYWAKSLAIAAATVVVAPELLSFRLRSLVWGRDRSLEGSSQLLSLIPGVLGQFLRRAFFMRVLRHCDRSVTIEFGTLLTKVESRLEENVYVGPRCQIGLVHIERDALIGPGVNIPSGPRTHGFNDPAVEIREQSRERKCIRIGTGCWIGSAAVVMADVGRNTVVGAGAVVTRPLPDWVVAVGTPARPVRERPHEEEDQTVILCKRKA